MTHTQDGQWWTVLGYWESTDEQFVDHVKATTPLLAAAATKRAQGEEITVTSVHPGRMAAAVPDDEWSEINTKLVCENADDKRITWCEGLYDDGGDGFDGYCPTCADKRDE